MIFHSLFCKESVEGLKYKITRCSFFFKDNCCFMQVLIRSFRYFWLFLLPLCFMSNYFLAPRFVISACIKFWWWVWLLVNKYSKQYFTFVSLAYWHFNWIKKKNSKSRFWVPNDLTIHVFAGDKPWPYDLCRTLCSAVWVLSRCWGRLYYKRKKNICPKTREQVERGSFLQDNGFLSLDCLGHSDSQLAEVSYVLAYFLAPFFTISFRQLFSFWRIRRGCSSMEGLYTNATDGGFQKVSSLLRIWIFWGEDPQDWFHKSLRLYCSV